MTAGGWAPRRAGPGRPRKLERRGAWLAERLRRHRGDADVARQELDAEPGVYVALRTVEREVASLRREMQAEARATVRLDAPPERRMQVDFGACRVAVEDEPGR